MVLESWDGGNGYLKVRTSKDFKEGHIVEGQSSGSRGTISSAIRFAANYDIDATSRFENGWDDVSGFLNDSRQVIQDSDYYQKFSYSIESPLQQHQFNEFVQQIIHPAGFIMFSDLQVRSTLETDILPLEAIISGPTISILSPDNYNVKYTAVGQGATTEEDPKRALGPNTGTIELSDK